MKEHGVSDEGREKEVHLTSFLCFSSVFLLMNLNSYTFRIHSSIRLKDFHSRLRAKAMQMFDFIFCFRQKLRESVQGFV